MTLVQQLLKNGLVSFSKIIEISTRFVQQNIEKLTRFVQQKYWKTDSSRSAKLLKNRLVSFSKDIEKMTFSKEIGKFASFSQKDYWYAV